MRLARVTPASWAFILGDDMIPMGDHRIFNTREDAVRAANRQGLHVTRRNTLLTLDCHGEDGPHSGDYRDVWHGTGRPARVCGQHAKHKLTSVTFDNARRREG